MNLVAGGVSFLKRGRGCVAFAVRERTKNWLTARYFDYDNGRAIRSKNRWKKKLRKKNEKKSSRMVHRILSSEIIQRPLQPQSSDTHEYIVERYRHAHRPASWPTVHPSPPRTFLCLFFCKTVSQATNTKRRKAVRAWRPVEDCVRACFQDNVIKTKYTLEEYWSLRVLASSSLWSPGIACA